MDLSAGKICKNFKDLKSNRMDFDNYYQILHNYFYVESSNVTSKKNKVEICNNDSFICRYNINSNRRL